MLIKLNPEIFKKIDAEFGEVYFYVTLTLGRLRQE